VTSLRVSPPPPAAAMLHEWVLSTSTQLSSLRAGLIEALQNHSSAIGSELGDVPERMIVVATELATNAIRHGIPPTMVRLLHTDTEFVLDVADHDLTNPPELAHDRPIDAGGRGLHLARALSLDVGWYATDTTKHIWAVFPLFSR
jgi:serine/threonine-protein kinase RsbW